MMEKDLWVTEETMPLTWNNTYVTDTYSLNVTSGSINTNFTNRTAGNYREVSKYYPIIVTIMVLSCLCLIFSLIVYSTLSEFRNLHGKNLISMSSCLLITFLMLILDLMIRNFISFAVCFTIAMVIHVTFLGTFFWTNIMAFDIWRSLVNIQARSEVKSSSNKYLNYSLYSWTATILTALPAAVVELTDWVPKHYQPQFGVRRCWLSTRTAFYYYFNLPVGVILFFNLVLFLLTVRKLIIIKKKTSILQVKQQQQRLYLYSKLFLVMGITWTTEFIPWITGVYGLYALAGMLTGLHGVFLFLIFVGKKKILKHFYYKCILKKKMSTVSNTNSSNQPTSSSSNSNQKGRIIEIRDSKF